MLTFDIPGRPDPIQIEALLLDYNGTIARDGKVLPGVAERLKQLAPHLPIFVLTADTFGTAAAECADLPVSLKTFPSEKTAVIKEQIARELELPYCAIGNGFNDIQMFEGASLSIAVMEREGVAGNLIAHADVLVQSPVDALDLLLIPKRLKATLRN